MCVHPVTFCVLCGEEFEVTSARLLLLLPLLFHPALVRAGNAHVFPVLGNGAASDLDAL